MGYYFQILSFSFIFTFLFCFYLFSLIYFCMFNFWILKYFNLFSLNLNKNWWFRILMCVCSRSNFRGPASINKSRKDVLFILILISLTRNKTKLLPFAIINYIGSLPINHLKSACLCHLAGIITTPYFVFSYSVFIPIVFFPLNPIEWSSISFIYIRLWPLFINHIYCQTKPSIL